ncbi:hypothetical protein Plhal304r1_c094g0173241 [Plasmopara halstedii]
MLAEHRCMCTTCMPQWIHKRNFFAQLNAAQFEADANDIVMGNFNLSMEPVLDATTVRTHSDQARPVLLEWLAQLGVLDA